MGIGLWLGRGGLSISGGSAAASIPSTQRHCIHLSQHMCFEWAMYFPRPGGPKQGRHLFEAAGFLAPTGQPPGFAPRCLLVDLRRFRPKSPVRGQSKIAPSSWPGPQDAGRPCRIVVWVYVGVMGSGATTALHQYLEFVGHILCPYLPRLRGGCEPGCCLPRFQLQRRPFPTSAVVRTSCLPLRGIVWDDVHASDILYD